MALAGLRALFVFAMSAVHFLWTLYEVVSIFKLVLIAAPLVLFSKSAWKELQEEQPSADGARAAVQTYRQLQLLSEYVNICYSSDMFSALVSVLMAICVVMVTIIVRNDSLVMASACVIALLMLATILFALLQCSANYHSSSQHFVRRRKAALLAHRKSRRDRKSVV